MNLISKFKLKDRRILRLVEKTLDKHFNYTFTKLDLNRYSEALIKETVRECMLQVGMVVPADDKAREKIWFHLAERFSIEIMETEHGQK
jgi:hypothetical protein